MCSGETIHNTQIIWINLQSPLNRVRYHNAEFDNSPVFLLTYIYDENEIKLLTAIDEIFLFFESKIHLLTNTAVMNPFFIQHFVK